MCQNFLPFIRLHNISLFAYTTFSLFNHCDEGVGCFQLLTNVNNAAVNIGVQIFESPALNSFGYIPGSEKVGIYSNPMFNLFLKCLFIYLREEEEGRER